MTYQPKTYRDTGGDRMVLGSGGSLVQKSGGLVVSEDGVGVVVAASGLSLVERGVTPVHKTVFTFAAVNVVVTNGSNAGYGSQKLYDFPAGAISIMGGLVDLTLAVVGANLGATADGDVHVGTTAQSDIAVGSIVATEHDIVATTAVAQLVAGAGPAVGQDGVSATPLDGTTTAKDAYLNLIFDTADISGDDAVTVNGTVTIYWVPLGDYS